MVWALLSRRTRIAYLAWTKTEMPIHTALLACLVSRAMQSHEGGGASEFEEQRGQFENLAIEILGKYDSYEDVEPILKYRWDALCGWDAIKIARYVDRMRVFCIFKLYLAFDRLGNAKEFLGHRHCQRWLEKEWLTSPSGEIALTSKSVVSAALAICHIGSNVRRVEEEAVKTPRESKKTSRSGRKRDDVDVSSPQKGKRARLMQSFRDYFDVFQIPFIKIIIHSAAFFFFLLLLLSSCLTPPSPSFAPVDLLVMLWVFGKSVEELTQYLEEMDLYLEDFWNMVCVRVFVCIMCE